MFNPLEMLRKEPRRKRGELQKEKKANFISLHKSFMEVIDEEFFEREYIRSDDLVAFVAEDYGSLQYVRRNAEKHMKMLGYVKMNNPNSKDGKWRFVGRHPTLIYRQEKAPEIGRKKLYKIDGIF